MSHVSSGSIRRRGRQKTAALAQERAAQKQEFLANSRVTRRGRRRIRKASSGDGVALSSSAKSTSKSNPFSGFSPSSSSVKIAKGDNLSTLLKKQGYSASEIYGKGEGGLSLIDRVSQANGLKNPNLIHVGNSLKLPSKAQPQKSESPVSNFFDGVKNFFTGSDNSGSSSEVSKPSGTRRSRRIAQREAAQEAREQELASQQEFMDNSVMTRRGRR